ncbi:hypothetical protein [Microcoleus sp. B9-D4]|uniref:hypothetical protein n=1 Tax=Microcoleus sp. B9-D4 TaxID=2818711 RepID=UPI002FD6B9EC
MAHHSIGLLFHLIAVTEIEMRSPLITDILGTEGARLPEAEFFWQTSIEFRTRINRSKSFSFILGYI